MKRTFIIFVSLICVALTAQAQMRIDFSKESPVRKLQIAEMAITNLYVDSVDEKGMVEGAIRGMLEKLDPHSLYLTAKENQQSTESLGGSFDGIGVQFNMVEDTLVVLQPVVNGPSEKVGILAGDRIVNVNGQTIAGVKMNRDSIVHLLRGPRGTQVNLGIMRRGIPDMLLFTVTRDSIPVTTIDACYMIRPQVGYIRIGSFGQSTYDEMMVGLDSLKQQGMKTLILDLQENGGGYLKAAIDIANEFLKKDDLIVYTEGRTQNRQDFKADGKGAFQNIKLYVLVNEYSASASEIVSGAMQDHDRAVIVGRRTFGKGLVQRPIAFPDGSLIRLTTAHYYTPSGRCIQKPYVKGESKEYAEDIEKRFKHGELYSADSIHFDEHQKFQTLRRHRTVYGGGGIMPDEFVPLDTMQYTRLHRMLAAKSVIINANLKYVDQNRNALHAKYKSFSDFNKGYEVPQSLIDSVIADGEKQGVKPKDDAELQATLPMLRLQLKALIARNLWELSDYFAVINESNHIVKRALQMIK